MKEAIKKLNKASLSIDTGISYSRLRKFSTGTLKKLTNEECEQIYKYLIALANKFKK
jgi:hypothetical protein